MEVEPPDDGRHWTGKNARFLLSLWTAGRRRERVARYSINGVRTIHAQCRVGHAPMAMPPWPCLRITCTLYSTGMHAAESYC